MAHEPTESTSRRTFLQTGAAAAAAGLAADLHAQEAQPKREAAVLPRRKLGKSGIEVTLLEQGSIRESMDRVVRFAFDRGVRVFDTAKVYGTEPAFKKWFEQSPEIRKQIVLVTKDLPRSPGEMKAMVDKRLEALGTDYIDLFFIHGFGDHHSVDDAVNMVTSKEFKETADAIRKSGKARGIGFSTHHKNRAPIITAAAEAGFIDAIMVQFTAWIYKDAPLNKAIDACWKNEVGVITMKQLAGQLYLGDRSPRVNLLAEVEKKVPMLAEKNLTPFQGLLHAIWTDERISASCVSMKNTDQIGQNADAARRFEPLKEAEIHQLRDALLAHGPTLCADCDGRCAVAAGTQAELGDLTRFLTYFEHHGDRAEARRQYAALPPEARDWSSADLEAARAACPNGLDFATLLRRVDQHLA